MKTLTLERVANLVFIGACIVLCGVVLARHSVESTKSRAAEGVGRGRTLSSSATLPVEGDALTVFVAVNSQCKYCAASTGFYRQLISRARLSGGRVRVIVGSSEPMDVLTTYLREQGVHPDATAGTLVDLPVTATPSMFVIGRGREILQGYRGMLNTEQEHQVLKFLALTRHEGT